MQDLILKAERDSEFAKVTNAKSWQFQEVCYWLNLIEFPQYIPTFAKHKIDGEIILRDMNATILHEDLEVRRFHTGKIVREIQRLRQMCTDDSSFASFMEFTYIPEMSAKTRIAELQELLSKLENEKKQSEEKMEELINRPKMQADEMIIKKRRARKFNQRTWKISRASGSIGRRVNSSETKSSA